ncbi:MAG TPA: DUF1501 domain-containing protein [Solirubrobacteraceae bacterium]|jgi:uncharacterized protein (DUF1501 family)|nr:DUF1501 domain-containing protein [Solirubrobacteraceae bacterium]
MVERLRGLAPEPSRPTGWRCTQCEEIDLARVRDVAPVQRMPVPRAALGGFPTGRAPYELTRRRLLALGMAGVASVYGPRALGWESVWESVAAQAAVAPTNCLVVLYLAGGNDGLNTLVPAGAADYSSYVTARTAIHRGQGATSGGRVGSTPLAGSGGSVVAWPNVVVSQAGGGDNGSSQYGFDLLYGNGGSSSQLAVLPGVDYTPPSLSHFDSADHWFAGTLDGVATGWLGRWIDRNGSATNPLQAVSIDFALAKEIRTALNPVSAIPTLDSLGFQMHDSPGGSPGDVDANATLRDLAPIPAGSGNAYLARSRSTYGVAVSAYDEGQTLSLAAPPTGVTYPANSDQPDSLSFKLRMAAMLIGANVGTRIVTIHWGSFDTHGDQLAGQDSQLTELSLALSAFQAELASRGLANRVATMVFSEFGRRVGENASGGTDHGAGGVMLLAGAPVRGGLAAPFPGCRDQDLDDDGDLKVPTDFRSVYASVLNEWLGDDPAAILPGTPGGGWPAIARQDSGSNLFR